MAEVLMPALGADMTEGTLLEWHVGIGDRVRRGDIIATVDTAKSAIDVEALQDGTIEALVATPGTTLAVGEVMATLAEAGARPVVEPAVAPPRPAASPAIQDAIGALMARSKREIPHFYLQSTIDVEACLASLEARNAGRSVHERILPAAALMHAVAQAARACPGLNGHFDGAFRPAARVNLGMAIRLREAQGLIAPAILDADQLSLPELMKRMKDLVRRAREGGLRSSEISESTITTTILGEQGADVVHGVIYPPQVALVGFGRIDMRPAIVDGTVAARRMVTVTLAADHRVSDGHLGSAFLRQVQVALGAGVDA